MYAVRNGVDYTAGVFPRNGKTFPIPGFNVPKYLNWKHSNFLTYIHIV